MESYVCRPMRQGEQGDACDLVVRVFNEFIAPLYEPEGIQEFMDYVQPDALLRRSMSNHFVLLVTTGREIVGLAEVRDYNHICLLFVDSRFQRRGIGRKLLEKTKELCRGHNPALREITVHSSPNSVPAYEKLGFHRTAAEQVTNGIRFTPMTLELPEP